MRTATIVALFVLHATTAAQESASRPAAESRPTAAIEVLPEARRAMRGIYRALDPECTWFVGADTVLAGFESTLFWFEEEFAERHRAALLSTLRIAAGGFRDTPLEAGTPAWRLTGAIETAERLLGLGPGDLPAGLAELAGDEAAEVRGSRRAKPRFVRSSDPGTLMVDWSVAEPRGIYDHTDDLRSLFRATVYLRHLAPADLAPLQPLVEAAGELRVPLRELTRIQRARDLTWGRPLVPMWRPGLGKSSLVPWVEPPESEFFTPDLFAHARERGWDPVQLVGEWLGTGLHTGSASEASFRQLYLGGLRTLARAKPGEWLGPAFTTEAWTGHRLEAAAWGYNILRQVDALALTGPTTGLSPIPAASVFVEPVPDFYEHMAGAALLLGTIAASLEEKDVAASCARLGEHCEDLLALTRAQARGEVGDAVLQARVREFVHRELAAPDWRGHPEHALDAGGDFRLARGPCRLVRVQIVWKGERIPALGAIVTTLARWPSAQGEWVRPASLPRR